MSNDKCLICKFRGVVSKDVCSNYLYTQGSEVQRIHLCYSHSVQLFKLGQKNFISKYADDFDKHGLETRKFTANAKTSDFFGSYYR